VLLEAGIGIYVDAYPKTAVNDIRILTTTPGWNAQFYATDSPPSPTAWPGNWVQVGSQNDVTKDDTIQLNTGGIPHRYWLVWITKLPPNSEDVALKLALYQQ
jgi:serine/threonine-protein kinase